MKDLGSATGVLVRLPPLAVGGHILQGGGIICLGKHQLAVESLDSSDPCLRLKCVAPAGSPLEHKEFVVGPEGGTLGRSPDCTVTFTTHSPEGKLVGVDSSISTTHSRIVFVASPPQFILMDGSDEGRASSNGTWVRLSPPGVPSEWWPLEVGAEIVIGQSRFAIAMSSTIVEHVMESSALCESKV